MVEINRFVDKGLNGWMMGDGGHRWVGASTGLRRWSQQLGYRDQGSRAAVKI